jgi:hypothetical protein
MKTIYSICLLLLAFGTTPIAAQKFLLIEKAGRARTERLMIFDELTFQLKDDDKGWYTRPIYDLDADAQLLQLGESWFSLADISSIRLKRQRTWANVVGLSLAAGGTSMILGDLWYTLRGHPELTQGGWEFGLVNIGVGLGLRSLLAPIRYKLGKNKRLRVIDVSFPLN